MCHRGKYRNDKSLNISPMLQSTCLPQNHCLTSGNNLGEADYEKYEEARHPCSSDQPHRFEMCLDWLRWNTRSTTRNMIITSVNTHSVREYNSKCAMFIGKCLFSAVSAIGPLTRTISRLSRVWPGQALTFAIYPLIITVTHIDNRVIIWTSYCCDHWHVSWSCQSGALG